jgi:predicted metalloprotease
MRWTGGRRSQNIEDRRGMGVPVAVGGGLGTIVLLLIALFFGVDPSILLQTQGPGPETGVVEVPATSPGADPLRDFVSVVLADTEDVWREIFTRMDREYRDPKLVLFTRAVESACGVAGAAVGPFYCPGDQKLYLDLTFFRELRDRFRAPGDFAQAYVIAHEVGHHVQTQLGISDRVHAARRQLDRADANALSVRMELQADCLAGIWAHHAQRTRQILEEGDIAEALHAAAAIGDDRIQKQTQGQVVPDSFTHGTSTQRVRWFQRGLVAGDLGQCDTFRASSL